MTLEYNSFEDIITYLTNLNNFSDIKSFLNSSYTIITNFITNFLNSPLISAALGAFISSGLLYWIISIKERRKKLRDEIQNINTAIILAVDILNQYICHKKDVVLPFKKQYDNALSDRETSNQIKTYLTHFNSPLVPIESLQRCIFEKSSYSEKISMAAIELNRLIDTLITQIQTRKQFIEKIKTLNGPDQAKLYFGLETALQDGKIIDTSYQDCMKNIAFSTDWIIWISNLLCIELNKHGEVLKQKLGDKSVKINIIIPNPSMKQYIPVGQEFTQWLDIFPDPQKKRSWFKSWFETTFKTRNSKRMRFWNSM
jgi:hypothetical protein